MKQRIQFTLFSIIICLIASIASLNAQTFSPYWDAAPAANPPLGRYKSAPIVGSGEYFYVIRNTTVIKENVYGDSVWQWSKCTGWKEIGELVEGSEGGSELVAIAIHDHYLYVGGSFSEISNTVNNVVVVTTNIARFNLTTRSWESLGYFFLLYNGNNVDKTINSIAVDAFGNVYASTSVGGVCNPDPTALRKWDGTNWTTVGGGLLEFGYVCGGGDADGTVLLATDGTNIFATGLFAGGAAYNGAPTVLSHCIIKWDGTKWSAMDGLYECNANGGYSCIPPTTPPSMPEVYVYSIIVSGTNVFVTGLFNATGNYTPTPANGIARFSATTGDALPDSCLYMGGKITSAYSLAQQNGMVYVTGAFDQVSNQVNNLTGCNNIAMWNSADNTWSALSSDGLDASGHRLAANDNAILVSGDFAHAGGVPANNFARWMTAPDLPTPAPPTGFTATPGCGQVALSWNASIGATSYNVKRSTVNGGPYTTLSPSPTGTNFTDTGLVNGTTYYYVVSAVNSCGESANSSQVSATPACTAVLVGSPPNDQYLSWTWYGIDPDHWEVLSTTKNGPNGPFENDHGWICGGGRTASNDDFDIFGDLYYVVQGRDANENVIIPNSNVVPCTFGAALFGSPPNNKSLSWEYILPDPPYWEVYSGATPTGPWDNDKGYVVGSQHTASNDDFDIYGDAYYIVVGQDEPGNEVTPISNAVVLSF